jgi:hypothetical protein
MIKTGRPQGGEAGASGRHALPDGGRVGVMLGERGAGEVFCGQGGWESV